ncbi:MAG: LytR/AlgR family response regulator transcription factor [Eubacterium sp.]
MIINIAVCDDEDQSLNNIHNELMKAGENLNISIETYLYTDGNKVFDLICSGKEDFDILFLDIDMPNISGLEVAKKIRKFKSDILLIFISAHEQYVFDSIEYNPFRYIRKNKMEQELLLTLKAAYTCLMADMDKYAIIKTEDGEVKVKHSNIIYYEVEARKIRIHMNDGRSLFTRKTIKDFFEELGDENFIRIHSGCVVNVRYINEFSNFDITLDSGERLIVSRRKIKDVKTTLLNYWRDKV